MCKIQALAESAGFRWSEETGWTGDTNNLPKFAELLIEECCAVIDENLFKVDPDDAIVQITEHFGKQSKRHA